MVILGQIGSPCHVRNELRRKAGPEQDDHDGIINHFYRHIGFEGRKKQTGDDGHRKGCQHEKRLAPSEPGSGPVGLESYNRAAEGLPDGSDGCDGSCNRRTDAGHSGQIEQQIGSAQGIQRIVTDAADTVG